MFLPAFARIRQTFTRFVQAGRVALINYGPDFNKLVVIVDLLDQNRLLVEGPTSGIKRQVISVKRLALTNILIDGVARGEKTADVKSKYDAADVDKAFAASSWGRKIASKTKRANLDDFGRFRVMVARMKKSKAVAAELKKLTA
jgi:large subunit ribosomal protein L14e